MLVEQSAGGKSYQTKMKPKAAIIKKCHPEAADLHVFASIG